MLITHIFNTDDAQLHRQLGRCPRRMRPRRRPEARSQNRYIHLISQIPALPIWPLSAPQSNTTSTQVTASSSSSRNSAAPPPPAWQASPPPQRSSAATSATPSSSEPATRPSAATAPSCVSTTTPASCSTSRATPSALESTASWAQSSRGRSGARFCPWPRCRHKRRMGVGKRYTEDTKRKIPKCGRVML